MNIALVTGGARAGKSRWAEDEALRLGGSDVTYVATAEAHDEEMAARIEAHRAVRPRDWITVEAPMEVPAAVSEATTSVVLLDCLTLWVSNQTLADIEKAETRVRASVEGLLEASSQREGTLLVVTNEVGLGLVPDNALGRRYRDALGWANARIARDAERVVLMVAGIPVEVR